MSVESQVFVINEHPQKEIKTAILLETALKKIKY